MVLYWASSEERIVEKRQAWHKRTIYFLIWWLDLIFHPWQWVVLTLERSSERWSIFYDIFCLLKCFWGSENFESEKADKSDIESSIQPQTNMKEEGYNTRTNLWNFITKVKLQFICFPWKTSMHTNGNQERLTITKNGQEVFHPGKSTNTAGNSKAENTMLMKFKFNFRCADWVGN